MISSFENLSSEQLAALHAHTLTLEDWQQQLLLELDARRAEASIRSGPGYEMQMEWCAEKRQNMDDACHFVDDKCSGVVCVFQVAQDGQVTSGHSAYLNNRRSIGEQPLHHLIDSDEDLHSAIRGRSRRSATTYSTSLRIAGIRFTASFTYDLCSQPAYAQIRILSWTLTFRASRSVPVPYLAAR